MPLKWLLPFNEKSARNPTMKMSQIYRCDEILSYEARRKNCKGRITNMHEEAEIVPIKNRNK